MPHCTAALVVAASALLAAIPAARAQNAAAGQSVFRSQCGICHSVVPGKNLNGPSLAGIVGRKAGLAPGFHYSAANKASGLTWNEPTLDRYLTAPRTVIPGTLMSYQGLHDTQKRTDLVAYLTTLR